MMVLMRLAALLALFISVMPVPPAFSHALEPGYLALEETAPDTWRVFWRRPDVKGSPMAIDALLPESCDVRRGLPPGFDGSAWGTGWITHCAGGLQGGTVMIEGLDRTRTDALVRIQPLEGATTTQRLTPDQPGFTVAEVPGTWDVFISYFQLGMEHILEGFDHLLFVFALLLLIRSPGRLVGAVTAFTVAHSITLALASLDLLRIPGPPVEAVIALSILFLAVEILKRKDGTERLSERFPWVVSFGFGLLHGLGFAGALSEIGLPQGDISAALLAFNLGVEAGQLTFIAVALALIWALRKSLSAVGRFDVLSARSQPVMAYAIGAVSTYWLVERISGF